MLFIVSQPAKTVGKGRQFKIFNHFTFEVSQLLWTLWAVISHIDGFFFFFFEKIDGIYLLEKYKKHFMGLKLGVADMLITVR